jgi:ankyrin repeat protein
MAADSGHLNICKFIIENVQDKNPADIDGNTPLHFAAISGNLDICKMIMENVQNRNPGNDNGDTPLHHAANRGHLDVCKLIIESMQSKNTGIIQGHSAAVNGQISELINVNPMNNLKHTPLYLAEQNGKLKVCEYFISLVEKEKK